MKLKWINAIFIACILILLMLLIDYKLTYREDWECVEWEESSAPIAVMNGQSICEKGEFSGRYIDLDKGKCYQCAKEFRVRYKK